MTRCRTRSYVAYLVEGNLTGTVSLLDTVGRQRLVLLKRHGSWTVAAAEVLTISRVATGCLPDSLDPGSMARGLPQCCAREVRVIAANHATARDNAGTRHAQGRVGGAGTPGIADYDLCKARVRQGRRRFSTADFSPVECHEPGLCFFRPARAPRSPLSVRTRLLSLALHKIFGSRASNFSFASIAFVLIRSYQKKNKNKIL